LALQFVPQELKTKDLCILALTKGGWPLQWIPQKLKTEELCTLAVTQHGWALQFVPEELKTLELCMIAVAKESNVLQHVPQDLKLEVVLKVSLEKPLIKQSGEETWFLKEISKKENRNLIYLYLGTKDPEIKKIFDKILIQG